MASVFYALHAQLLAEFATILDKSADAEEYTALHEKIRTAIVNKFYRPATGECEEGTKTAQIVDLWAGMPRGTAEEKNTVQADRKRVVKGKSVSVRGDIGGGHKIKKK